MTIELLRIQRENSYGRLRCRDRHSALGEEVFDIRHGLREELCSLIDVMVPAEERNIVCVRYHLRRCPGEWELSHVDFEERRTEYRALGHTAGLLSGLRESTPEKDTIVMAMDVSHQPSGQTSRDAQIDQVLQELILADAVEGS